MEKYLKRMFEVKNNKIDVQCRIKDLVGKTGQTAMGKTLAKNYEWIIKNAAHLEKRFDALESVERLWQAEGMLQDAMVGATATLPHSVWLLEKVLLADNYAGAISASKANELVKSVSASQASALVWAYVWSESNALKDQALIAKFIKAAKQIRAQWAFGAFVSEEDYALISQYGGTTNRSLKNPGTPTLRDIIVAPVMNDPQKLQFDVTEFFHAFPEFKTLERNPAWGHYGGYALESISQIVHGPIKLAAECLMAVNLKK